MVPTQVPRRSNLLHFRGTMGTAFWGAHKYSLLKFPAARQPYTHLHFLFLFVKKFTSCERLKKNICVVRVPAHATSLPDTPRSLEELNGNITFSHQVGLIRKWARLMAAWQHPRATQHTNAGFC